MSHSIKVEAGRQISVSIQNEPGTLAELTAFLGTHDINIYALTLTGGIDHGYVRMVVSDHPKAVSAMREAGYLIFERDVVLVEIPNTPGSLAHVAAVWAKEGVNVEYTYCAGGPSVTSGLVVIRVDDTKKALSISL